MAGKTGGSGGRLAGAGAHSGKTRASARVVDTRASAGGGRWCGAHGRPLELSVKPSAGVLQPSAGLGAGKTGGSGGKGPILRFEIKTTRAMSTSRNTDDSLTSAVSNEITHPSIDLAVDYGEMLLDSFLQDGVLKEIPFIKTIYAVGKIGSSIREQHFVKKLFVFLREFHKGTLDLETVTAFREQFDMDPKYKSEITEQVMIYLDAFVNLEKSKILARLFRAHVEGKFDWNHFNHLSNCLNDINPKAFGFLEQLSKHDFQIAEDPDQRWTPRNGENESLFYACGVAYETSSWSSSFKISELGMDLYNYGIK